WACHLNRPSLAYRYMATACSVAEGTDSKTLQAQTLGAFSYYFSSAPRGGHGGDPDRALSLLDKALTLAERADGFTTGWLATWRADQYATLGKLANARADIDLAAAGLSANDHDSKPTAGFFARATYGYGMTEHLESVSGFVAALAGAEAEAER